MADLIPHTIPPYEGEIPRRSMGEKRFDEEVRNILGYMVALEQPLNAFAADVNNAEHLLSLFIADADRVLNQANAKLQEIREERARMEALADRIEAIANTDVYQPGHRYSFPAVVIAADGGLYRCMGQRVTSVPGSGGASGQDWLALTPKMPTPSLQPPKTADFTAYSNKSPYATDTSGGSINITLEPESSLGAVIEIFDVAGGWGTNPAIILPTKIMGQVQSLELDDAHGAVRLQYAGSGFGWQIL